MKKCSDIRQKSLVKNVSVLTRMLIVILFVKFQRKITRNHNIFSVNVDDIDWFCMFRVVFVLTKLLNLIRSNVSDRQVLQHFKTSFGRSSPSCNCKNHWAQFFWNWFLVDLFTNQLQVLIRLLNVKILVGAVGIKKRCADTHLHDVLSKTFQEVNGSSNTGISSKSNQSAMIIVRDLLIVDKPNPVFQHFVQSWHIVRLSLCYKINLLWLYEKKTCKSYRQWIYPLEPIWSL